MKTIQQLIQQVVNGNHLDSDDMTTAMGYLMSGNATDAQTAAFLTAMRLKGESDTEMLTAIHYLRSQASPLPLDDLELVDIVGTGGDGAATFNISTTSAIVASAAGCQMAKYGNRSASGNSGSAEVLQAAGLDITHRPDAVAASIRQIGLGYLFAPNYHQAFKHIAATRKEIGFRTFFNWLGPFTHPNGVKRHVIGVYQRELIARCAKLLQQLGSIHALVVHSQDGLDEISINAPTNVAELKNNQISYYQIEPKDFGLQSQSLDNLRVENPQQSLALVKSVLDNQAGRCQRHRVIK